MFITEEALTKLNAVAKSKNTMPQALLLHIHLVNISRGLAGSIREGGNHAILRAATSEAADFPLVVVSRNLQTKDARLTRRHLQERVKNSSAATPWTWACLGHWRVAVFPKYCDPHLCVTQYSACLTWHIPFGQATWHLNHVTQTILKYCEKLP